MQSKTTDVHHKGQKVGISTYWQYVNKDAQFNEKAHCVQQYGLAHCTEALNMGLAIKAQAQIRDSGGLTYDVLALALCIRIAVNWETANAFVLNADTNLKQFAKTNQLEGDPIDRAKFFLSMDAPQLDAA